MDKKQTNYVKNILLFVVQFFTKPVDVGCCV